MSLKVGTTSQPEHLLFAQVVHDLEGEHLVSTVGVLTTWTSQALISSQQ